MVHSTHLPSSHEWCVKEAAGLTSASSWIKSPRQERADGSYTVAYLAIHREARYCCFNPKSKKHTKQCGWHLWKRSFKSDSSHAAFVLIVVDYEVVVVIFRK